MTLASTDRLHHLTASADHCVWGYIDPDEPARLTVADGDRVRIDAVSHHAGDAPDLTLDAELEALWAAIPPDERGPGVHILSGPIEVVGAEPGMALAVSIGAMTPRHPFGANVAAHWGLLYDTYKKERVTVYALDADAASGSEPGFGRWAHPEFAFDFTARPLYDAPGFVSAPADVVREPVDGRVRVPVRPHLGVMGVAPAESGRLSSIPPGPFGGNVDNWRFGPGATLYLPVFRPGAGFYVGDPHFAQGDGEICGTAIEASATVDLTLSLAPDLELRTPLLETADAWYVHGFGDTLDAAMRQAAEELIIFIRRVLGVSADDAYSIASVAADLGVTQVVDGTVGCHAAFSKAIIAQHANA